MLVKNSAGKEIETTLNNQSFTPFKGGKKHSRDSKIVKDIETALRQAGLKSGMTISFHHQLRNGDFVINNALEAINNLGVNDIRLAQTALFNVHEPLIDYIKDGVITRIEGSVNGVVGDFISTQNPLKSPVILRSHGGRWAAVKSGELHPDIAIIAASSADARGNATGLLGKSAFGNIAYSPWMHGMQTRLSSSQIPSHLTLVPLERSMRVWWIMLLKWIRSEILKKSSVVHLRSRVIR